MGDALSEIFEEPENLFSILETLEDVNGDVLSFSMFEEEVFSTKGKEEEMVRMATKDSNISNVRRRHEIDEEEQEEGGEKRKKMKLNEQAGALNEGQDGQPKMSHITVERNRRKQMNEHLVVLRTLMPCFYVKRGDQASIIGGVVEYIKELQQLLQSLEAKKQRKLYSEVLSPRPLSSPRPQPSPRRPSPLCSPRVAISPRTPQPGSPYKPNKTQQQKSYVVPSPSMASSSSHEYSSPSLEAHNTAELIVANYRSSKVADVEVKFSGPNVLLKTVSHRIPGQALKIITLLEGLALEILHVTISSSEDTMLFSFTIKIGIECELSAEELANEIQQTFS